MTPPDWVIELAAREAARSPCAKSKRGVVMWVRGSQVAILGHNRPALGECEGSDRCRRDCARRCVHAEQMALLVGSETSADVEPLSDWDLLHLKVDSDGMPLSSGGPSCLECSKLILHAGIGGVWLLQQGQGWVRRTADEFHRVTLLATVGWV